MRKRILVTGASGGLGLHLSLVLARRGHAVTATMRNLDKQEALKSAAEAEKLDIRILKLDVEDAGSIEACIGEMVQACGGIDVLVNNAGAGFVRTTEQASEDEIRWVMDVNFMGVVRCTKAALPQMRAQRAGHVINISSIGGLVGQPFNEIYCAAKFAVEGYTESMASYMDKGFGIKFTAIEPGGISSDFARNVMAQFQAGGGLKDDAYRPLFQTYLGAMQGRPPEEMARVYQTPEAVAEVIAGCIEMDAPPVRMRTSEWSEAFCQLKTTADPDGTRQQKLLVERLLS